jgi:hypothetical protein
VTRTLAIHQPNYLPWLGYFDKMRSADVFVLLDAVQYPRGASVANRTRVRQGTADVLLTVPVAIPGGRDGKAAYTEVRFADDRWRRKHVRTIEQAYARASHLDAEWPAVRAILEGAAGFCEMTVALVRRVADRMGIATPTPLLSELGEFGQRNEMIAGLCAHLDCDTYLSGTGAAAYNDAEYLAARGVELRYQEFVHPVYPQAGAGFVERLSALDALLCCGGWPGS